MFENRFRFIGIVLAVLFIIGCGGSGDSTPTVSEPSPSPTQPSNPSTPVNPGTPSDPVDLQPIERTPIEQLDPNAITEPRYLIDEYANFEVQASTPMVLVNNKQLWISSPAHDSVFVYDVSDSVNPTLIKRIPTGLSPVSIAINPSTNNEVWVVNNASDSITVFNKDTQQLIAILTGTIRPENNITFDEPTDIVFSNGKAFVSAAMSDAVYVFDASTYAEIGLINVPAKEPRALSVDTENQIWIASSRSGNKSSFMQDDMTVPEPLNPSLPPAPEVARIVDTSDPLIAEQLDWTLPDNDVCQIDVDTLTISKCISDIGNIIFDITFSNDNTLWVANTLANNTTPFVDQLRGNFVQSRLTHVGSERTTVYSTHTANHVLTDPVSVATDDSALFVAFQGSDSIAKLDKNDASILLVHSLSNHTNKMLQTQEMRGPRALLLDSEGSRVFSFNQLAGSFSIHATDSLASISETIIGGFDPEPLAVRLGRKFLFDARLSGNGTNSCASCHVDSDTDHLAWDLGDRNGEMSQIPELFQQGADPALGAPNNFPNLHPMKGPMVTQTLKGIAEQGLMHWRGDKRNMFEFNSTFENLMGGSLLDDDSINLLALWSASVFPSPNPIQNLDETLTPRQQIGQDAFTTIQLPNGSTCAGCHQLPIGSNLRVRDQPVGESQSMEIAPLRQVYRKQGMQAAGDSKLGFGYTHDGTEPTLEAFVTRGLLPARAQEFGDEVSEFLLALDSGTSPLVGHQIILDSEQGDESLLIDAANRGRIDLIAFSYSANAIVGLKYQEQDQLWRPDSDSENLLTLENLREESINSTVVLMGVYPGTARRLALDFNQDGQVNRSQ